MTEAKEWYRSVWTDLYKFAKTVVIDRREGWVTGDHIEKICHEIQAFLRDPDAHGLMISCPPRHMKSVIISNILPAWYISLYPQREVIMASYALSLARDNLRACRNLMDEPFFKPRKLEFEVDSADSLQLKGKLNGRPNIVASGTLGGITGKGADLFIIDDPVKDALQADSKTYRDRLYEWYKMVAVSRLSPGGKVILVSTRWHYEDLQGQILRDSPEGWKVINFPAISDDGKALWPQRYDLDKLETIRKELGTRCFTAQYLGSPQPLDGGLIKRAWLKTDSVLPNARKVRYWDKASTHGDGDWTVGCLMAESDGQYVVEDIVRLQGSPREVQETIVKTAERDGKDVRIIMEQEPGSSGVDIIDHYARHLLKGYPFKAEKVTGSKETRASAMIASLEMGNLWFAPAQWNRDLFDEMCEFPLGKHDDQVDACSGAFRALSSGGQATLRWL